MRRAVIVLLPVLLASGCFLHFRAPPYEHLQKAEELSRQGEYEQAIAEYREHMNYRLHVERRPEWENPFFYLLLIADIQLGQGKVGDAIGSIELAESNKVDRYLIADRFRAVATWYEKQGRLPEAADILGRYRERDPDLFDAMQDRINKAIVERENAGETFPPVPSPSPTAPPTPISTPSAETSPAAASPVSSPAVALPGVDAE